jgi:hypothetical protein
MMNRNPSGIRGLVTSALFASSISLFATGANADVKVCNNYTSTIRYSVTYQNPNSCGSSSPWAQHGWWTITPGTCATIWSGNAAAMGLFWEFALAQDGRVWPGTPSAVWKEPLGLGPTYDVCFNDLQNLSCSNAGSNCVSEVHQRVDKFAGFSATLSYSK